MSITNLLDYELRSDGVAVLTLNNPPLNLNTISTLQLLRERCVRIADDDKVRVVVVTGAGSRAFCAGSDIREFRDALNDIVTQRLALENEAFTALAKLPVPVIAALNGVALGGGAEIALACDIRIMADNAKMGFPEIKLGVFPGSGGVVRLPRLVGSARAYELLYTGKLIGAAEAERVGLVNRVVAPEKVQPEAMTLAATLARGPALALSIIRRTVRESLDQPIDVAIENTFADSGTVFKGSDAFEGIHAFFEKRAPVFTATRNPTDNH